MFTDPNSPSKELVLANWQHQSKDTIHRLVEKNLFETLYRHLLHKYYEKLQLIEGAVAVGGHGRRQGHGHDHNGAPAAQGPVGIEDADDDGAISDSSSNASSGNDSNGTVDESIDEL